MHELSVSSALADVAINHARGRKVLSVQVRVGTLRQVVPDSLAFYWDIVTRDTACDGARLDLEVITARLHCGACAHAWEMDGIPHFRCPECGAADAVIDAGNELEVETIEIEDQEEAACTA